MSKPTPERVEKHISLTVDKKQSPVRIDKFIMSKIENVTRSKVQNAIADGLVKVNDELVKPNYKVRPFDVIDMILLKPEGFLSEVIPEEMPLDIVYEDDYLLVLNKPPGLVVHPGVGNYQGTLVNGLAHYFKEDEDQPIMEGNDFDRPWLVHRIDKDTSGLLLIAKLESAMNHLAEQFFNHSIERSYHALVWGSLEEEGTIDANIGRHPTNRLLMHVYPEGDEGKRAVTHYKTLEDLYYVSYVECKLETGRTHQIRAHMNYMGSPIFNDERYGGDQIKKGTIFTKYKQFVQNCFDLIPRQALHAKSLGFIHPVTNERMYFESELPSDFEAALNKWRNYHTIKIADNNELAE